MKKGRIIFRKKCFSIDFNNIFSYFAQTFVPIYMNNMSLVIHYYKEHADNFLFSRILSRLLIEKV